MSEHSSPHRKHTMHISGILAFVAIVAIMTGMYTARIILDSAILGGSPAKVSSSGPASKPQAPPPTAVQAPAKLAAERGSPKPTATATPKPVDTATPLPPLAPSMSEMLAAREAQTDVQFDGYQDQLKGQRVAQWSGEVTDVVKRGLLTERYMAYVDVLPDNFGDEVHLELPAELAMTLQKGQIITFSGTIDNTIEFGGLTVFVDEATIH